MAFEIQVSPSEANIKLGATQKFYMKSYGLGKTQWMTEVSWLDQNGKVLKTGTQFIPYDYTYEGALPGGDLVRLFVEARTNDGQYQKVGVRINVILPELTPVPQGVVYVEPRTIRVGEVARATISTLNIPDDAEVDYTWKVNGVIDAGEKSKIFDYRGRREGRYTITCEALVNKEGFAPVLITDFGIVEVEPALEILVSIDCDKSIYHVGEQCVIAAHPSNVPADAHVMYTWFKGAEEIQASAIPNYAFTITEKGEFEYTCKLTYIASGGINGTVESNTIDIHVINSTQTITVGLLANSIDGVVNVPIDLRVNTIGAPEGAVLKYYWYIDGTLDPSVQGATYAFQRPNRATYTVFVDVSSSKENYDPVTARTQTVELLIKDFILAGVVVTPASMEVEIGEEAKLTAIVDEVPEDTEVKFTWSCNGSRDFTQVTSEYTCDTETPGKQSIEVHVEMTNVNYLTTIKTNTGEVMVAPAAVPDNGEFPFYVHPLPWRASAYIWCGWWVMDEIQEFTKESKNWKTDESGKYWLHRKTLAMMLDEFTEVDVQESRNGYIIHRTALEAGIIY